MSNWVKFCILLLMISSGFMYCTSKDSQPDKQASSAEMGWLKVEGADLRGHRVLDPVTGEEVGFISNLNNTIEIPEGKYTVMVGSTAWNEVEVRTGETTVLQPGRLEVKNASYRGHSVLEAKSGEEHGQVSSAAQSITLVPGKYKVSFGNVSWEALVEEGKTTILNPGVVTVNGASPQGNIIRTADGREVGYVSHTASSFTLPPGDYTIEIGGKPVSFSLEEGQTKSFDEEE
jgi:hypothetical protein